MKDLIKPVIVLALILAGYAAYIRFSVGAYGIGSDNPLGKFSRIDKHLTGQLQLEKREVSGLRHPGVRGTARMYQYQRKGDAREHLDMLLDGEGNVRGVVGWHREYQTGARLTSVGAFSRSIWTHAGGAAQPDFTSRRVGRSRIGVAEFASEQVIGTWTKGIGVMAGWEEPNELIYLRVR